MDDTLPSNYGSGGDASSLGGLASSSGALPASYGAPTKAQEPPAPRGYGAAAPNALSDFARGLTGAVQTAAGGGFQSSGKASVPTPPPSAPSSDKWKVVAGVALAAVAVGGAVWYFGRKPSTEGT
jgi:hypothetical protein